MPLSAGSRLGPYEIEAAVGEGGMGEVYRARDTRLGRTVAIKILHGSLAADPSFAARFAHEARTLSRIAHPNICALHDVGLGEPTYLVLEFLEGETLADRIARGPLPFEDVRRLGAEICRALETAHKAGIVHRDLKPANVMLTRSGAKLLDFGIASEHGRAGTAATTRLALTQPATIIGTAAYISPEQLQGRQADARSDLFALGAVLHECATGGRAFSGGTPAAIAAAILSSDPPPPSTLRAGLPAAFDAIVAGCLEREPDERWQSAHDIGRQLAALPPRAAAPASPVGDRWRWLGAAGWTVAALALAVIAVGAWAWRRAAPPAAAPASIALKVQLPANTVPVEIVEGNAIALSPDGSQLAWVAVSADTTTRIWLRPLSQVDSRPLAGTDGASTLFWSPDGKAIAFFANGLLQRLDIDGAGPIVICAVQRGVGYSGTWGAEGRILFAPIQGDAIQRVSTSGGTPEAAFVIDRAAGERRIGWPWFLPDGRSVLYMVHSEGKPAIGRLMLARADGSTTHVGDLPTEAQYVDPGYLVYGSRGALLAQRFDPTSGTLSGAPVPLASNIQIFPPSGWGGFSVARNGTIAFLTFAADSRLTWIDAAGRAGSSLGGPGHYLDMSPTVDWRGILAARMDNATGVYDIWAIDVARGTETRLTSGPGTNVSPLMLAASAAMIYSKATGGPPLLHERDTVTGAETMLAPTGGFQSAVSVTRDGGTLVYVERHERGDWDILTLPLRGAHTPSALVATAANEDDGRLSPDDRVFAFVSDETGHREVYVTPFPRPATKLRLSAAGGRMPRWSDAHTLLFLADDGRLMRTTVTFDGGVRAGAPAPAFVQMQKLAWRDFLPLPGGRLLAIVPEDATRKEPLTVITHAVR